MDTAAADAAAERIKAATLSAAKGLSRAQAERAAARNVNAYGQKEEGPSKWQERKEAKRQMYLMSTEKAVKLGVRKDVKTGSLGGDGGGSHQCQKCFQIGHWTYECKNERVYISRPSRSQQLKNPSLRMPFLNASELHNCDWRGLEREPLITKNKRRRRRRSVSSTSSSSSESTKNKKRRWRSVSSTSSSSSESESSGVSSS